MKLNQVKSFKYFASFFPFFISLESFIFNINQLIEQETNQSINIYPESSPKLSLSSTSSIEQDEQIISNHDNHNIKIQIPSSSSSSFVLQETKQLLDILSSSTNQDLYSSRLASEV